MMSKRDKMPGKYALTKELWVLVVVKLAIIMAIWAIFFAHPAASHIKTDQAVATHIFQDHPV